MSSNSGDEMVDVKEVGNDVDETLKINLKDETAEGEAKGAPLSQETEESIENGEVKTVEIDSAADDMVDKAVVEEERVSDENVVGIPDVKSAETSSDDDDDASKKAEVDANGIHDEYFNVKLKSEEIVNGGANEDVVNAGANEDIADMDTKENEESHANVSNEKSEPEKYEDIVNSGANEDITDMDTKGNEDNQANVSNENSSPEKYEDIVNDDANEDIGDMNIKENEESQANVSNGKSLPEEFEEDDKVEDDKSGEALEDMRNADVAPQTHIKEESPSTPKFDEEHGTIMNTSNKSFLPELSSVDGYESGTEEEQAEFADEVKTFYRENNFEYKAPKFYKEDLNLLKLWRAVIKLGGYEQVTSCKLWRQVGESFRPPKTCTTVSWTFRIFYEKALLEYEKHKMRNGELPFSDGSLVEPVRVENQVPGSQALGSGRARRDAAARAMQGWHSQRLLGNGEVCQPIIKDKNSNSGLKADKQLKTNGLLKRKKPSSGDRGANVIPLKSMRMDSTVIDIGPPADWVKVNVQRTSDCFEIYALVPGLLREEVHVQSDPAGRLIISGEPEHPDNPWGVTSFKKVVSLPSRIDPHQTSAVVTLHGQLFVRVPFEQLDV